MRTQVHLALVVLLLQVSVLCGQQPERGTQPPPGLHLIDAQSARGLRDMFRHTGETLPLVSAHRGGASKGHPENCLATFENTLKNTFAILEIDPRYTKDGEIVIHHDATLDRTTTGSGRVEDYDLAELRKLRLKDVAGNVTDDRIPTLDEALEWARGKTVLVLDQKDVPVKARVQAIEKHRAESYAMLIVYSFEGARECYQLNKNIMLEVMITDQKQFEAFDKTGVPWGNVIAFVGHNPPRDRVLLSRIHGKGATCLAGTSRNLDRELAAIADAPPMAVAQKYRELLASGVDLIEADLASEVGQLLYGDVGAGGSKAKYFLRQKPKD